MVFLLMISICSIVFFAGLVLKRDLRHLLRVIPDRNEDFVFH
jgi:hypothetical protein